MDVKILLILSFFPCFISTEPVELTDKTWKTMLNGQWMVEFYAPWCSACQHFKRVWNDYSNAMLSKNVKVAAVDVDKYPGLSNRFRISALPTIYHVHDGVFRQFNGERSLNGLRRYIEHKEWEKTEPVSSYFGPTSILMSLVSSLFDVSVFVRNMYIILADQYGWPTWLIYIVFGAVIIFIGILLGFGTLTVLDYFTPNTINQEKSDADDSQALSKSDNPPPIDESSDEELIEPPQKDDLDTISTDEENEQTVRQRQLEK